MSKGSWDLYWLIKDFCNINALKFETEYRFHVERKWRADFAIPEMMVLIEYQGGVFMNKSGHSNIKGQTRDQEKMNQAQILGWKVLQYSAKNYTQLTEDLKKLL